MKPAAWIPALCLLAACTAPGSFPVAKLLENTLPPQHKIVLTEETELRGYKPVDVGLYNDWLAGLPVPELDNKPLPEIGQYEDACWIDHRRSGKYIIFSMLLGQEYGYTNLYNIHYDTIARQVEAVHFVDNFGGDGGDYKEAVITWHNDHIIRITSKSWSDDSPGDSLVFSAQDSSIHELDIRSSRYVPKVLYSRHWVDTINTGME